MATRKILFLWDMVTGEFYDHRTYARDLEIAALSKRLKEATGEDGPFVEIYAEMMIYTVNLEFQWQDGAPEHLRALEAFWKMVRQGKEEVECWRYYSKHVSNLVLLGETRREAARVKAEGKRREFVDWQTALARALEIWIPETAWKLEEELAPHEAADPLSSSSD